MKDSIGNGNSPRTEVWNVRGDRFPCKTSQVPINDIIPLHITLGIASIALGTTTDVDNIYRLVQFKEDSFK